MKRASALVWIVLLSLAAPFFLLYGLHGSGEEEGRPTATLRHLTNNGGGLPCDSALEAELRATIRQRNEELRELRAAVHQLRLLPPGAGPPAVTDPVVAKAGASGAGSSADADASKPAAAATSYEDPGSGVRITYLNPTPGIHNGTGGAGDGGPRSLLPPTITGGRKRPMRDDDNVEQVSWSRDGGTCLQATYCWLAYVLATSCPAVCKKKQAK